MRVAARHCSCSTLTGRWSSTSKVHQRASTAPAPSQRADSPRASADAGLAKEILATCWHLINDSYRIDLCLHHPPHIIAIAVILIAGCFARPAISRCRTVQPRCLFARQRHAARVPPSSRRLRLQVVPRQGHAPRSERVVPWAPIQGGAPPRHQGGAGSAPHHVRRAVAHGARRGLLARFPGTAFLVFPDRSQQTHLSLR